MRRLTDHCSPSAPGMSLTGSSTAASSMRHCSTRLMVLGEEAVDWASCDLDAFVSAPGSTREIFPFAIASALASSVSTDSTDLCVALAISVLPASSDTRTPDPSSLLGNTNTVWQVPHWPATHGT